MANTNHILNCLFTQKVFRELISNGYNRVYQAAVEQYAKDATTNLDAIQTIYTVLSSRHRNEYFYLNTLLLKRLANASHLDTTTALTQIPVENSIADFILMNGNAVAYEIKTELDNFERMNIIVLL